MPARRKANTTLRIVNQEFVFDEATGLQKIEVMEGMKQDVETAMAGLVLLEGVRATSRRKAGPWYELAITWAGSNDGTTEPPVDKWSVTAEMAQEDIRTSPNVIASAGGDTELLALWVKEIKEALKDGEALEGNPDVDPGQQSLYNLYARGAEAYETKRFVLRRTRVIPPTHADTAILLATELIYTTAQIISTYGVPQAFRRKLPADPSITPPQTMWGWRERTNSSEFDRSTNKIIETYEWVFAAWSTVLYNPA